MPRQLPTRQGRLRRLLEQKPATSSKPTAAAQILQAAKENGSVTAEQIYLLGFTRQYASLLVKQGRLRRIRHGVYALPKADTTS